jgi:hypothetical protein
MMRTQYSRNQLMNRLLCCLLIGLMMSAQADAELQLDWGNAQARVTETIHKNNTRATLSYQLQLDPHEQGLVLRQTDVQVLSLNEQSLSNQEVGAVLGSMATLPQLLLSERGEMIEVIDQQGYVKGFVDALPDSANKTAYDNPMMQNMLIMQAYQKWCSWVCLWAIEGLAEDQPVVDKSEVPFMGVNMPQTTTTEHLGPAGDDGQLVRLRFTSVTGIEDSRQLVEAVTSELGVTPKPTSAQEMPDKGAKRVVIEALVEPDTLKPHKVTVDSHISINTPAGVQTRDEQMTYEFEWLLVE